MSEPLYDPGYMTAYKYDLAKHYLYRLFADRWLPALPLLAELLGGVGLLEKYESELDTLMNQAAIEPWLRQQRTVRELCESLRDDLFWEIDTEERVRSSVQVYRHDWVFERPTLPEAPRG